MASNTTVARWAYLLCRLGLAAVFIVAGVLKVIDPLAFTAAIETYHLFPYTASVAIALFLPWLEIICGLGLVFRKGYKGSLLLIALMLAGFLFGIIQGWQRGLALDCGCFGSADVHDNPTPYLWLIVRDLVLWGAVCFLWLGERTLYSSKKA